MKPIIFHIQHLLAASLACASLLHAETETDPIPFSEIGAKATADYQGDAIGITSTPEGARLHTGFQKLAGNVTSEGLMLDSTGEDGGSLKLTAASIGRNSTDAPSPVIPLPSLGKVSVDEKLVRWSRPGLVEEYSVSADGVRQDFIVATAPAGTGELSIELALSGARAEAQGDGVLLTLDASGRELAYTKLLVEDATGRVLPARFEVLAADRLVVRVEDAGAVYPVRIDPTFSDADWVNTLNPGRPGANNSVHAAVVDGSGNLYIGGSFTLVGTVLANRIAKWNGSAWTTLGTGMSGVVSTLVVSGTDIYAGGFFTSAGGVSANRIAKWNGTVWSALGTGMDNGVRTLAVSGTDLYAGGDFTTAGLVAASRIAKWNGTNWSALGTGFNGGVYALAVSGTNVYAGGGFSTAGGVNIGYGIAKWDGSVWSALGTGMNSTVLALAASGTDLYAGGDFVTAGGVRVNHIAKWNGGAWSALGTGMNNDVQALAVTGTDLYAGGVFTTAGGVTTSRIAKWNGSAWSALGTGMDNGVLALAASGTDLYVGGYFTSAGGLNIGYGIAEWKGSAWSALGTGMNSFVYALAVSGSDIYAGGEFVSAGGVAASRIAKWNGSVWSALSTGMDSSVLALAVSGTDLYAGGVFTSAGGVSVNRIAKWDGSTWTALGTGMNENVWALAVSGADLYAGGWFTSAGGVSGTSYIAKWNGSTWLALGTGMNSGVTALVVSGTDLYAGGSFSMAGGVSASRIAKWNGSAWSSLGTGMNSMNSSVDVLAVSGTDLYAGGQFTTAGGVNIGFGIAKWSGGAWSALGTGMNSSVRALAVSGTDLYAGGFFTTAGGVSASRIAKWNGSAWSALGSGVNDNVSALALDVAGQLVLGGGFSMAGTSTVAPFIVRANITPPFPEIAVSGNGQNIANGDATPSAADSTAFGSVVVTGGAVTRTFTITNSGTADLTLTGSPKVSVSGSSDFAVTSQPASPISGPGGSSNFTVRFTPTGSGPKSATLSIANNDGDENPFVIGLSGTVLVLPIPVFQAPANTTFSAGVPVMLQLSATFSPTFAAVGLPPGLFLDPQTGRITGVTALTGEFSIEVTLTNGTYTGEGEFTLHILPAPPIILSPARIPAKVGVALELTVNATGNPSGFSATGLPPGLSIHPTSGLISGIPSAAGVHPATVSATNVGGTTQRVLTFEVADARIRPQISSPSQAAAVQGQPFQYLLSASGSPTAFAIATLPAGLSYDPGTGGIVGTPLAFGRFEIEVRADSNDLQGETTIIEIFIEASPDLPRVILPELPLARLGNPFSLTLSSNPVGSQIHWEPDGAGTLPAGLVLATNGQITGTPTAPGAFPLRVWATNSSGTGPELAFELFVAAPLDAPNILAPSSLSGKVGVVFSSQIAGTNPASTFTARDLPAGISLNSGSGVLTGTPTAPGVFIAGFTATAGGISGPEKLIAFQIEPEQQAPAILGPSTWNVRAGEAFVIPLVTSGEPDGLQVSGLPAGLGTLEDTLQIYGTTGETGLHEIEIVPVRGGVEGSPFLLELTVEGSFSSPVISGPETLAATVGQPFTWSPSIQTAPGDTLAFVTADGLPAGIQLDTATGTLSGSPLRSDEFKIKLQASGSFGSSTPFELRLEILPSQTVPRILNAPVLELIQGDVVSVQLTATPGPVSAYGATDLPPGLSIDRINGLIQGIARESGSFTAEVFASNSGGTGPRQPLRFVIASALGAPRVTPAYLHGVEGQGVSVRLLATALPTHGLTTPLPDGFGFIAEDLPAGLAIDPTTGYITGALGAAGEYEYRAAAFNEHGIGPWVTGQVRISPASNAARILGPARVIMRQGLPSEVTLQTEGMTAENSIDWKIPSNFQIIGTAPEAVTLVPEIPGESSLIAYLIGPVRKQGTRYYSRGWGRRGGYSSYTYYEPGIVSGKSIPVWIEPDQSDLPEMTTASLHVGEVGALFSLAFSATYGPTGYHLSGNLPQGLTFDGSGLLGTPEVPGRYAIRVRAMNPSGHGLEKSIELLIAPAAGTLAFTGFGTAAPSLRSLRGPVPLSASTPATPPLQVGVYSSLLLQADADVTRVILSGLPSGLLLNTTTGEISGIPEKPGIFPIRVRFENPAGTGPESTFALRVEAAPGTPVLNPPALPPATAGSPYSASLTAPGATAFGGDDLPDFLTLDPATGSLGGIPPQPGEHTITFHAVNENGRSFPVTTNLIVAPAAGTPVLSGPLYFTGTQGVALEHFLTAIPAATVFEIESLPPGLALDTTTGRVHGSPAIPGLFTLTVSAANATGWSAPATVTLDIHGPAGTPELIVPEALVIGAESSFSLQIAGEPPPLSFEGKDLPTGLTIDPATGFLSTSSLAPGIYVFTLNGINALGTGGSRRITLLAGQPADVWRAGHFGATATVNPALEEGLWGNLADPDKDGRSNMLEYHDGTLPHSPDTPAPSTIHLSGDYVRWRNTYTRRPDLTQQPEFSTNLGFDFLLPVEAQTIFETGNRVEVEYSVERPPEALHLFFRMSVEMMSGR